MTRGRRPALDRSDLASLLAQVDAMEAAGRKPGRARRSKADQVELGRLRRLLAEAIAGDDPDDEDEDGDRWDDEDGYGADEADEDEGDDGDWWPRRRWERFAPAKPIRVEGGLTTRSRRGAIGETWWSKRFLDAVEPSLASGRSTRGKSYARQGQVVDLAVGAGVIEARVQGTRSAPYRVRLAMAVATDDQWDRVTVALAGQAGYAARLLAGELPHEIEDVFAAEGVPLFPSRSRRLSTDCTCPDWANPCKHVAAVCYLVAEAFDRDPFAVLAWRGRDREAVLERLRQLRHAGAEPEAGLDGPAGPGAAPAPEAPPLADCLLGFWKAGPELAEIRIRPEAAELPAAVLRHLPRGVLEVRGRDVAEILEPAYADLAAHAAQRAVGPVQAPSSRRRSSPAPT
ncbi:MAG: SWIM zinc finger family protein [Acidimicrobiales bacterium]